MPETETSAATQIPSASYPSPNFDKLFGVFEGIIAHDYARWAIQKEDLENRPCCAIANLRRIKGLILGMCNEDPKKARENIASLESMLNGHKIMKLDKGGIAGVAILDYFETLRALQKDISKIAHGDWPNKINSALDAHEQTYYLELHTRLSQELKKREADAKSLINSLKGLDDETAKLLADDIGKVLEISGSLEKEHFKTKAPNEAHNPVWGTYAPLNFPGFLTQLRADEFEVLSGRIKKVKVKKAYVKTVSNLSKQVAKASRKLHSPSGEFTTLQTLVNAHSSAFRGYWLSTQSSDLRGAMKAFEAAADSYNKAGMVAEANFVDAQLLSVAKDTHGAWKNFIKRATVNKLYKMGLKNSPTRAKPTAFN